MTKHSAEFLRARSSNVSLRTAAATSQQQQQQQQGLSTQSLTSCDMSSNMRQSTAAAMPRCVSCESRENASDPELWYKTQQRDALCEACTGGGSSSKPVDWDPKVFTAPFCEFLEQSPTVFHAVEYFKHYMRYPFEELPARADWTDKIKPGCAYYVTRNGSSLIAFTVGKKYVPGNGVAMVAAHIDALTARLKPVSSKPTKAGYVQLGVSPYAGALNETWWDRDLGIGGRVVVQDPDTGKTATKLVKLSWPIAKISTLAPHFGVGMMGNQNKETEAVPIIGLESPDDATAEPLGPAGSFVAKQPPRLVKLIAKELGIKSYTSILDWELELFDTQPATVLGLDKEFITAGRIDDKLCSWSAVMGFVHSHTEDADEDNGLIRLVALFDDEEIGSLLRQGARGNFMPQTIERIVEAACAGSNGKHVYGPGMLGRTYAASFLVSADVTHAVHPNFLHRYEADHAPRLNTGVAICADSNGHMTTDAVSTAMLEQVAARGGLPPLQRFMIRNDSRSGGTVGPALSSAMGVRSIDAGLPQLAMHSIRATTGALDPGLGAKFFKAFYREFEKVDKEWH